MLLLLVEEDSKRETRTVRGGEKDIASCWKKQRNSRSDNAIFLIIIVTFGLMMSGILPFERRRTHHVADDAIALLFVYLYPL